MSGEEFFKFNKEKGIYLSSFKLRLNIGAESEQRRNELLSVFDMDKNGVIDGEESSLFLGSVLNYAGIIGDEKTLDTDEAELMLSFVANSEGKSLKEAGYTVSDIFEAAEYIQKSGQKSFQKRQEKYFSKQSEIVQNQVLQCEIKESNL